MGKKILGVILFLVGIVLALPALFSPSGVLTNISDILKGPHRDYGWQQYSMHGTSVIISGLFLLCSYYLFKKGKALWKSK